MKTYLCRTKNNIEVYVDLVSSHAATHFQDSPQLKSIVMEILRDYTFGGDRERFEVDLKRTVGKTALVETSSDDEIVYARRPNRTELMRFVKHREPEDTTFVTLDLKWSGENTCELHTAYIGRLTPKFPGHPMETAESRPFWSTHALIWGMQEIVSDTLTSICPWL